MIFSHELSVRNRLIDSEHKKLNDIINEVARIIKAGEIAALSEAFELLENSLCDYFVAEENIAQALDFDFTRHRLAHRDLLRRFQCVRDQLVAKNGAWLELEVKGHIDSLRNGLIRHIKEDDKPFKSVLDSQFYDFKPN